MIHVYAGRSSPLHVLPGRHACHRTCCCCCRRSRGPLVSEDMFERAVKATLADMPGHERSRLIYSSSDNAVKVTRYAIFVDELRREVVIAIRGTLSVSDAITDLLADPVELTDHALVKGLPGHHYVHLGFWEAAQNVLLDLEKNGVIHQFVGGQQSCTVMTGRSSRDNSSDGKTSLLTCQDYGLLVVGHSLGAGVAQLLVGLLRLKYHRTRCLAYGAPAVCSEALARRLGEVTVPCVVGDDIIARLSVRNMELLRDRMIVLTAHCQIPKYRLLWKGIRENWEMPTGSFLSMAPTDPRIVRILAKTAKSKSSPSFFHAGRVVHLQVTQTKRCWCGRGVRDTVFRAHWVDFSDFQEVLITRRMFAQHVPNNYRDALENVVSHFSHRQPSRTLTPETGVEALHLPGQLEAE